jgi:putative adhesin
MPVFDTPEPISVSIEIGVGDIQIAASDRTDTVVEVRPSDPAKEGDVTAAEQTRVGYASGRLVVKAPRSWRQYTIRGGAESIDVRIDLPAGSHLAGEAAVSSLRCTGRLGECRYKTSTGDISLDEAGPVTVRTGAGDVWLERASGHAEVTTGTGSVRIGAVDGTAAVRNSSGDTSLECVTGDARVRAASGSITIGASGAAVAAKTAKGDIRLREVARGGAVVAETAFGAIDIGIGDGVAAWLDLHTRFGQVRNDLDAVGRPEPGQEAAEVRAYTSFGDITIARAAATSTRKDMA